MSTHGLAVFDKTIQTTNAWLDEIMDELNMEKREADRQIAWHALGAVLHAVRDRMPVGLAAHLGAELPLLVRGLYYDQYRPESQPVVVRELDQFLALVEQGFAGTRSVNAGNATHAVLATLSRHLPAGQINKAREALPKDMRDLWPVATESAQAH